MMVEYSKGCFPFASRELGEGEGVGSVGAPDILINSYTFLMVELGTDWKVRLAP